MPIELVWEKNHILHIKYFGIITGAELRESQEALGGDARFDSLKAIIADGSQIEQTLNTEKDIQILSAISIAQSASNPQIKNAIVLSKFETGQALASFYQMLAEDSGWKIELFHSEEEARRWLAL
jgi:hypothetical protein